MTLNFQQREVLEIAAGVRRGAIYNFMGKQWRLSQPGKEAMNVTKTAGFLVSQQLAVIVGDTLKATDKGREALSQ